MHFNLYVKVSLGTLDLHLNFIKFTVKKVDSHGRVVPSIL